MKTSTAAKPPKPALRPKEKIATPVSTRQPESDLTPFMRRPAPKADNHPQSAVRAGSGLTDLQPLMQEEAKAKIAQGLLDSPDALPLSLWLNFPRPLVAGYGSIIEAKIENIGATSFDHLCVTFESKGLGGSAEAVCHHLAPGHSAREAIEVTPVQAGNFVLRCNLKSRRTADAAAFRGSLPITINVAPETANLAVNMSDIQCVRGGGLNPGVGQEFGAVNISNLLPSGLVHTLNDLLNVRFPESFGQVPLERDYEVTGRVIDAVEDRADIPWSIPKQFLTQVEVGTKLKLEPVNIPAGEAVAAIHLVARNQFRLGRSRQESDFLTWFWPRSPENDERTRRISKVHVIAESSGDRLILSDAGSANRSTFEGQPLSEKENDILDQRGTLILGHEYHLDVTPFESTFTENLQVANIRNWSGPPEKEKPDILGAVRFMPINSEPALHNAVWIFTDAYFGCSRLNAVILDIPGAAEVEGRFSYFRKNFWIESLPTGSGIRVGDYELKPLELVPIVTGAEIVIAGQTFQATVEP